MNRREFIKASLAGVVAVAAGSVLFGEDVHVLYRDGVHDDTKALQAWVDGKTVVWPDGKPVGRVLKGGEYLLSDTLYLRGNCKGLLTHAHFSYVPPSNVAALTYHV